MCECVCVEVVVGWAVMQPSLPPSLLAVPLLFSTLPEVGERTAVLPEAQTKGAETMVKHSARADREPQGKGQTSNMDGLGEQRGRTVPLAVKLGLRGSASSRLRAW